MLEKISLWGSKTFERLRKKSCLFYFERNLNKLMTIANYYFINCIIMEYVVSRITQQKFVLTFFRGFCFILEELLTS